MLLAGFSVIGASVPAAFTNEPGPTMVLPAASSGVSEVAREHIKMALQFAPLGENARLAKIGSSVTDVVLAVLATTVVVTVFVESALPSASASVNVRLSLPTGAPIVTAHCTLAPDALQPGLVGVSPTDVETGPPFGTLPLTALIVKVSVLVEVEM